MLAKQAAGKFYSIVKSFFPSVKWAMVLFVIAEAIGSKPFFGQQWTGLTNQPSFTADNPLLLTDGTVMVHGFETSAWWKLTPDINGSYINGTWTQLTSMPSNYSPLYFASAVLSDGRVVIEGGEYNGGAQAETNQGAIYDPNSNSWTTISPPSGWSQIGDAQSVVLANETFMLGNCCYFNDALLNATNLTWTSTGTGKADANSEEGWTLLPSGNVLTVDVQNGTNSEIYNPSTGAWTSAGSTGVQLSNPNCTEIGPAVLRPDGTVFATGGLSGTAIYNSNDGTWSAGPSFPNGLGINDGPAALLPDGNVLVAASATTPCYAAGIQFFEFDGSSLNPVPGTPNAGSIPTYSGQMLVLPSGQILFTSQSNQIEIYTPSGTYQEAWQPVINSVSNVLDQGSTNNSIGGSQFNGLSQGASYGDDAQSATNYPIVRIVNNNTGHVFYAKTHDHSTMGVATGSAQVTTEFDVSSNVETGPSQLYVVANGIPSSPVSVTINPASSPWQVTLNSPPGGCYGDNGTFTISVMQETSGTSLNWYSELVISPFYQTNFYWELSDDQGYLSDGYLDASGGQYYGPNVTYGPYYFTTSRAPVGTPTVTVSGYYIDNLNGCYMQYQQTGTGYQY